MRPAHVTSLASLILAPLWLPGPARAQDSPEPPPVKIAVTQFTAPGFEAGVVENLYGVFVAEIDAIPNVQVVSRDEIEAMLGFEQQKALLGCDDTSCLAEIAGALGVDKVIAGKVGKVGKTFVVNISLIDHKTARVEKRLVKTVKGEEDVLIQTIISSARELMGRASVEPAVAGAGGPQAAAVEAQAPGEAGGAGDSMLPLILLAGGGAGVLVGAALAGVSALRYGAYQESTDGATARDLAAEVPVWWIGSGVAGGVGLLVAAAGGVLFAVSE